MFERYLYYFDFSSNISETCGRSFGVLLGWDISKLLSEHLEQIYWNQIQSIVVTLETDGLVKLHWIFIFSFRGIFYFHSIQKLMWNMKNSGKKLENRWWGFVMVAICQSASFLNKTLETSIYFGRIFICYFNKRWKK